MPQRKCPKCQHEISGKTKFCPNCGVPLTKSAQEKAVTQKKSTGNKSTSMRDAAIIVGLLAVVAVIYFIIKEPSVQPQQIQQEFSENTHPDVGDMGEGTMGVLSQLPADYSSLIQYGNQTMDAKNFPMAAECYKRALSIDPSSPDVRTDYGACLHGMGLGGRAIEEFQKVLKSYPNHTVAIFNLGIVFYSGDMPDSAKHYWNKFLTVEPDGQMSDMAREYLKQIEG